MSYYYRSRLACDVLEEMRVCFKTLNFRPIEGLIEELQTVVNRMESGLGQRKDLEEMDKEWSSLKKELKQLKEEVVLLEKTKGDLIGDTKE